MKNIWVRIHIIEDNFDSKMPLVAAETLVRQGKAVFKGNLGDVDPYDAFQQVKEIMHSLEWNPHHYAPELRKYLSGKEGSIIFDLLPFFQDNGNSPTYQLQIRDWLIKTYPTKYTEKMDIPRRLRKIRESKLLYTPKGMDAYYQMDERFLIEKGKRMEIEA